MQQSDDSAVAIGCFILTMLLVIMFYLATPAKSQEANPACAPKAQIDKRMWVQFGESPIGVGITQNGIVYVTHNPQTHTFTIIIRRPDGIACLMTGGVGWENVTALTPGRDL